MQNLQAHISMSFVVYFACEFFPVFSRVGEWRFVFFYLKDLFCEYLCGVDQSFKLDCCPFFVSLTLFKHFRPLLSGITIEKSASSGLAKFLIGTVHAKERTEMKRKQGISISLLSVFWKRRKHSHKLKGVWKLHRFVLPPVRFM